MKGKRQKSHQGPSRTSLKEIPEIDFARAKRRPNQHAARIALEGLTIQVARGRPQQVLPPMSSRPRSIRFPDAVWQLLERRARAKGLTLHAALRQAVVSWAKKAA